MATSTGTVRFLGRRDCAATYKAGSIFLRLLGDTFFKKTLKKYLKKSPLGPAVRTYHRRTVTLVIGV